VGIHSPFYLIDCATTIGGRLPFDPDREKLLDPLEMQSWMSRIFSEKGETFVG
jgi:hypothetical protein